MPAFPVRALHWLGKELKEVIPPTVFFFLGFGLIVFTMDLMIGNSMAQVATFTVIAMGALVVGKSVLVANTLPFLHRFDAAPLVWPILFKTFIYWACVFIARLLEELVRFWITEGHVAGFGQDIMSRFAWNRFIAIQLWILVLFLIYVTATELNTLFGDGELTKLFFHRASSETKLIRRRRIRTLVQISELTAAHPVEELRMVGSAANQRLLDLLTSLAARRT